MSPSLAQRSRYAAISSGIRCSFHTASAKSGSAGMQPEAVVCAIAAYQSDAPSKTGCSTFELSRVQTPQAVARRLERSVGHRLESCAHSAASVGPPHSLKASSIGRRKPSAKRFVWFAIPTTAMSSPNIASVIPALHISDHGVWYGGDFAI